MVADLETLGSTALVVVIVVAFYMLPTIIGVVRQAPAIGPIVVVNLLLGWTFVGWVVALALAARTAPPDPT